MSRLKHKTGRTILQALEQPRSLADLVKAVTDEYDVTDQVAEDTTKQFLDRCVEAKLVSATDT